MKSDFEKPCVLLLEQDENYKNIFCRHFERGHYNISIATDSNDAIIKAIEMHPAMILIDEDSAKGLSVEVKEKLRKIESLRMIPILVVSNIHWSEKKAGEEKILLADYRVA